MAGRGTPASPAVSALNVICRSRIGAVTRAADLRIFALAGNFLILASPPLLQCWGGGDTWPYLVATLLLAVVNLGLVLLWRYSAANGDAPTASPISHTLAVIVTIAAGCALVLASHAWLHQILTIPNDPQRADMLIVVQQGIRRVVQGKNPYTIYHVP